MVFYSGNGIGSETVYAFGRKDIEEPFSLPCEKGFFYGEYRNKRY